MSKINVLECGAKGDGKTDDTAAIQDAINRVAYAGGGTVFFPYTRDGYLIASPAVEEVHGFSAKSQLYIDGRNYADGGLNICLEGEMPVCLMHTYQVRPNTQLAISRISNTRLVSSWEAPEQTDPALRPYAMLSVVEGTLFKGKFSAALVTLKNLEFRGYMNPKKMYPTGSCVNLKNTSRCIVQDCHFGLDKNVGDAAAGLELQPNPSYTAGLIMSGDQNDDQVLRNVCVQGYKYGFILGEMVVADYLYVCNCEEGIVFHDVSHASSIQHIVAQHNRTIISALRQPTFGLEPSYNIFVNIGCIDFEPCHGRKPVCCNMRYGVYDPDNRIHGALKWHSGCPVRGDFFPVEGAAHMTIARFA